MDCTWPERQNQGEKPKSIWILVPGQYEDTEYCSKKIKMQQFNGDKKNTILKIPLLTINNHFGQFEVNIYKLLMRSSTNTDHQLKLNQMFTEHTLLLRFNTNFKPLS